MERLTDLARRPGVCANDSISWRRSMWPLALIAAFIAAEVSADLPTPNADDTEALTWQGIEVPVPAGWTTRPTSAAAGADGYRYEWLLATPDGLELADQWFEQAFYWTLIEKSGGIPESELDLLHLRRIASDNDSGTNLALSSWQTFGSVRASRHTVVAPDGKLEQGVVLSYGSPGGQLLTMLYAEPADGRDAIPALTLATTVFERATGQSGLGAYAAALAPTPANPRVTAELADRQPLPLLGRQLLLPAGWQLSINPDAGGGDVLLTSGPDLQSGSAPRVTYLQGKRQPDARSSLNILRQLVIAKQQQNPGFTQQRLSAMHTWACSDARFDWQPAQQVRNFTCVGAATVNRREVVEIASFTAEPSEFERLEGVRLLLSMSGEIPLERWSSDGVLSLHTIEESSREPVEPFPPLTELGAGSTHAPAGWHAALHIADGVYAFSEPGNATVNATLLRAARLDTGADPTAAIEGIVQRLEINDFEVITRRDLPQLNGLLVDGSGELAGVPIRFAAVAEQQSSSIFVFYAPAARFEALGGAALLGPVYLEIPADELAAVPQAEQRIALLAERYGARLQRQYLRGQLESNKRDRQYWELIQSEGAATDFFLNQ